jgi:23S rRNA (guanosine2251-2'-O)-methyltransferase
MELVAVLDNIRSIHNVGSMFRTADAVGISRLYLCGITPTPVDRFGKTREAFRKVSLGAEQSVLWEHAPSCAALVAKLQREKFLVCAVEQQPGARSLFAGSSIPRSVKKIALVFGNEVDGVSPRVLKRVDRVIEIPMRGSKESLNVSVAFGIAVYHIAEGVARRPLVHRS